MKFSCLLCLALFAFLAPVSSLVTTNACFQQRGVSLQRKSTWLLVERATSESSASSLPVEGDAGISDTAVIDQQQSQQIFRSKHWKDLYFFQSNNGVSLKNNLDNEIGGPQRPRAASKAPVVTAMHRNKDGRAVAVQVSSALSEWEASAVQALAAQVRSSGSIAKSQFVNRSFGTDKGGNDCTYLAPLLQAMLPTVASQVINVGTLAWKAAGWNDLDYPEPGTCGIRTSEQLSYKGWKSLEGHKDVGSMYTTMIALAEPSDYQGGDFFVQNRFFDPTDIKPDRLEAVVFLSDTVHGVRPITGGMRETFVTELWENDDSPLGLNRPTPERWQEFLDGKVDLPFD